ncbi:MAG: low molecular weight phosphotyrosine protein phosphatase [Rhodobacteraceae bacterium]|nr:low molecular weight phosphotyrosine protein phosphatase [Paracoccaceae bacterium]
MSYRVLFVCTGNICRSPTAEGVFRKLVADAGLADRIDIESAGTHGYHVGEPPDPRSIDAAAQRGVDISRQRARRVQDSDFERFDLILALDQGHLRHLRALRREHHRAEIRLLLDFHADQRHRDVPDPYYGGSRDFELALDLIEAAGHGLLASVQTKLR